MNERRRPGSLALLLQFATLLLGSITAGVSLILLISPHRAWVWLPSAVLLAGWAALLGVQFAFLGASTSQRASSGPRAAALLRAWWVETWRAAWIFGWQQPFRSTCIPDHAVTDAGRGPGVVLVHGFFCNRGFWNPWLQQLAQRGAPFVAVNLEPVFGSIDDYVPIIEAAVLRVERATGRPPIAVAHSMGGLALRRWWAEPGNHGRIDHAITLGTPHHGTALARWGFWPNTREMRQNSLFMRTLAAREGRAVRARLTCFWSDCDNVVFPVETATLDDADNRLLPGLGHVEMAWHPAPRLALLALLDRPAAPSRAR